MNSTYVYRKHLLRKGSRESDQNKRPLHLRVAVLIGGAGFRCRIGGKKWRLKVAYKDKSGFTIKVKLTLVQRQSFFLIGGSSLGFLLPITIPMK